MRLFRKRETKSAAPLIAMSDLRAAQWSGMGQLVREGFERNAVAYRCVRMIAEAAGMDYRTLIAEILAGGLKRLREKRREAGGMNGTRHRSFDGLPAPLSGPAPLAATESAAAEGASDEAVAPASEDGKSAVAPQFLIGTPDGAIQVMSRRRRSRSEKSAVR